MPFEAGFNDIYEYGIRGACSDVGLYCERVDEQVFLGSMLERIYSQISRADLLVADMSGKNPNVFYEVGYAHALGKNVVLLTSVAKDIPFDLKHFPHIVYGTEIKTLRAELARWLKHLSAEESITPGQKQIGLELFHGKERLADGNVIVRFSRKGYQVELILMNNSTLTYKPGEFRIAIIVPKPVAISQYNSLRTEGSCLPDGTYMYMLGEFDTLFPGAATKIIFGFLGERIPAILSDLKLNMRVFSTVGLRDFPLMITI